MKLGTQIPARNDDDYRIMAQLGVTHVNADPAGNPHDWTRDILEKHRDHVESFGLVLDMVQLPLASRPIEAEQEPRHSSRGPGPRPADRFHLPPHRELRRRRHPGGEVQHEHHRHPAHAR